MVQLSTAQNQDVLRHSMFYAHETVDYTLPFSETKKVANIIEFTVPNTARRSKKRILLHLPKLWQENRAHRQGSISVKCKKSNAEKSYRISQCLNLTLPKWNP